MRKGFLICSSETVKFVIVSQLYENHMLAILINITINNIIIIRISLFSPYQLPTKPEEIPMISNIHYSFQLQSRQSRGN